jgi:hypothetical protein
LCLASCGDAKSTDFVSVASSDNATPVTSSWDETGTTVPYAAHLVGDTLYYIEHVPIEGSQTDTTSGIYKKLKDSTTAEQVLSVGNDDLVSYCVAEDGTIYCLYAPAEQDEAAMESDSLSRSFYLKKLTPQGGTEYDKQVIFSEQDQEAYKRLETASIGAANGKGEVCFTNSHGDLYIWNQSGELSAIGQTDWDQDTFHVGSCGVVIADEDELYTYTVEGTTITYQNINMADGTLDAKRQIQLKEKTAAPGQLPTAQNTANITVISGYNRGMFLMDTISLWEYHFSTDSLVHILDWNDSSVNLSGFMIDDIGSPDDESLYVMAHQSYDNVTFVHITQQEGDIPQEKEIVTIGISDTQLTNMEVLGEAISRFNRRQNAYQVEIQTYENWQAYALELVNGGGPDIISEVFWETYALIEKGVIEDLSPYFENSTAIQETDFFPSILRASRISDKMYFVFPSFIIYSHIAKKEVLQDEAWTPEALISLGERYPESSLTTSESEYYLGSVFSRIIYANLDQYINWQERTCSFNDDVFISQLEKIVNLPIANTEDRYGRDLSAIESITDWLGLIQEDFHQNKLLMRELIISTRDQFNDHQDDGYLDTEQIEFVGYPNHQGIPFFEFNFSSPLSIRAKSNHKEGAWAFLEYILSAEYQDFAGYLPVRIDTFEKFMSAEQIHRYRDNTITEESVELLRYLIDNSYWFTNFYTSESRDIRNIVAEEAASVWAGDKTPAQAAEIIQNRVSLVLQE